MHLLKINYLNNMLFVLSFCYICIVLTFRPRLPVILFFMLHQGSSMKFLQVRIPFSCLKYL